MKIPIPSGNRQRAFTLIEVMIAAVIFFAGTFVILALVSSSLENARHLEKPMVDASVLASQLSLTNQLVEGSETFNLGDLLGKAYNDYDGTVTIQEEQTNKLFRADFTIQHANSGAIVSQFSALYFRPQSPAGSMDGATTAR